jgi:hypothetical protein
VETDEGVSWANGDDTEGCTVVGVALVAAVNESLVPKEGFEDTAFEPNAEVDGVFPKTDCVPDAEAKGLV